ncbi:MAG: beta-propeller fold lactonase family protein [Leptospirales bacterium]
MAKTRRVFSVAVLMALLLFTFPFLSACGGGGGGGGGASTSSSGSGSGSGSSKTIAGVIYGGTETSTSGGLSGQYLYTDGTVETATNVATYCNGNNDHGLMADTAITSGTTYLYSLCRDSGYIVGWSVPSGTLPSATLTQVASVSLGGCCLSQMAISKNGQWLLVANNYTNTVSELEVSTNGGLTSKGTVLSFSGSYGVYSLAVSPSGNYLVLARANSAGSTYYLDEYALDESTGGLTQVGSDVTGNTLNTFGGMAPAPNTNNGDLVGYTTGKTGSNGAQLIVVSAGGTWGSSNIVTHSFTTGSGNYGTPTFDTTGKYIWLGSESISSECSSGMSLRSYSIGTNGSSISLNGYVCGTANAGGVTNAYDSTDNFFIANNTWDVSNPTTPVNKNQEGNVTASEGEVFIAK